MTINDLRKGNFIFDMLFRNSLIYRNKLTQETILEINIF